MGNGSLRERSSREATLRALCMEEFFLDDKELRLDEREERSDREEEGVPDEISSVGHMMISSPRSRGGN